MKPQKNEIIIVGGGMVGSAIALGLAQHGLKVNLIERVVPLSFDNSEQPNVRISALNLASIDLLRGLGVWDTVLCSMRTHAYHRLEIWEQEDKHVTFNAKDLNLPYLGYMVENNVLQQALWQALKTYPNVTIRVPTSLVSLRRREHGYHLTLNNGDELLVALVIGADGANSQVRQMSNISIHAWQYYQSCMLITAKCDNDPGNSTWQHFTPDGPRAFLPLFDHWASLVWYDTPSRISQLNGLSMPQLQHEIKRHFPSRLGKVIPMATRVFPLVRRHAIQYIRTGLVLVGDAAHTIHPLAGQGVNLGYRDIEVLLDVISHARTHGEPWTSLEVLSRYQHRRMTDNFIMQLGIDLLYAGFSNNLWPISLLRNLGLIAIEGTGCLKRQILKYALGL